MLQGMVIAPGEPAWPPGLVELYRAERTSLVRTAFLICGSVAAAEDAVHDALPRVAGRWTEVANGRGYLYTAVVNAARDANRRARRYSELKESAGAHPDPVAISEESMALHRALSKLPERQRTAVVLRHFADWTDDEIAEQLHARPATVRSLVHRGIERLRREMEQ
ncbi:MAG TPA: sigma-70 family RNA polymerase sigma factor [Acidimicrobiia bacterium]|nr:sigma-70 family RNA polymerase sigma factor [Acidimicrobiia bacterium]